jgi:hypothetical protein
VQVRDTAAWTLSKMLLHHIACVDVTLMPAIVDTLAAALPFDEPRVGLNITYVRAAAAGVALRYCRDVWRAPTRGYDDRL